MTKILIFIKRKNGLSHDEFKEYYENKHCPLITRHFGKFHLDYRRNYTNDIESFGLSSNSESFDKGEVASLKFDVVTEIWLENQAAMDAMFAKAEVPEIAAEVAADEEKFVDRATVKFHVVDEYPKS